MGRRYGSGSVEQRSVSDRPDSVADHPGLRASGAWANVRRDVSALMRAGSLWRAVGLIALLLRGAGLRDGALLSEGPTSHVRCVDSMGHDFSMENSDARAHP